MNSGPRPLAVDDTAFRDNMVAAIDGDATAQTFMGMYYYQRADGPSLFDTDIRPTASQNADLVAAFVWWTKAAKQGNVCAQHNLASCYYGGLGVERCRKHAIEWMERSAASGHVHSIFDLGVILLSDPDADTETKQRALALWKRAANAQFPPAQHNWAWAILQCTHKAECFPNGVVPDRAHGLRHLKAAAARGFAPSIGVLSEMERQTRST